LGRRERDSSLLQSVRIEVEKSKQVGEKKGEKHRFGASRGRLRFRSKKGQDHSPWRCSYRYITIKRGKEGTTTR